MLFQTDKENNLNNPLISINHRAKENDLCFCEDTGNTMIRKKDEWIPYTPKVNGEAFEISLYDLNKTAMNQMFPYNEEQLAHLRKDLKAFEKRNLGNFYMILNNESHYYTILHFNNYLANNEFYYIDEAVLTLMSELGDIVAHEIYDDHIEIWVKNNGDSKAYLLFNYDRGVVTYG